MIGRCSLDSQHVGFSQHPANFGCSYFRYTNKEQSNNASEKHQRNKWTREDKKKTKKKKTKQKKKTHCYFKSNPTQRECRKWMVEIWTESAKYNTSQRLTDQARLILKKSWLSDLDTLEICGQVNCWEHIQRGLLWRMETQNIKNQIPIELRYKKTGQMWN